MTGALYDAGLRTHLKIVMTALIAAIVVMAIGISARLEPTPAPDRPVGGLPAPARTAPDDARQGIPVSVLPAGARLRTS
jgi:hypothetical protein